WGRGVLRFASAADGQSAQARGTCTRTDTSTRVRTTRGRDENIEITSPGYPPLVLPTSEARAFGGTMPTLDDAATASRSQLVAVEGGACPRRTGAVQEVCRRYSPEVAV